MRWAMKMVIVSLVLFLSSSCAVVSQQARTAAQPEARFQALAADPDRYLGKTVILGGYIIQTTNMDKETRITVLQTPLNIWQEPNSKDTSEGRFIVSFSSFLDPEVYSKDRKITIAGTVKGSVAQKLNDTELNYPLVEGSEIHLWTEYPDYYHHPYYPYFYDYRHFPHSYYLRQPYPYWRR